MRLYTRTVILKSSLGIDDCLCLVSTALTFTFSILIIRSYSWGVGRHIWDVPTDWLVQGVKYLAIACYVYLVLAAATKLTFLFLYRRIFSTKKSYKYALDASIWFTICAAISLLFVTVFGCIPVERTWDARIDGHCFNPDVVAYFSGAVNSLTDMYILILPLTLSWRLNINVRDKWKLTIVFGLGLLACAASLVRLGMTSLMRTSSDTTWNASQVCNWSIIEVNVGITCSCLLLLPAFLDRHIPETVKSTIKRLPFYWPKMILQKTKRKTNRVEYGQDNWLEYHKQAGSESRCLVNFKPAETEFPSLDLGWIHRQPESVYLPP